MTTKYPIERDLSEKWDQEYQRKGIPSSVRGGPSGALEEALLRLGRARVPAGTAVDIGCGSGRNSLYLADCGYTVCSIDFVARMISRLQETIRGTERESRISAYCQSVTDPWPVPDHACDLAVDMFCFKHLVTESDRSAYIQHLVQALAPTGHFLLTLAGQDDGYYGSLPRLEGDLPGRIILDPGNQIRSALYERDDIEVLFSKYFALEHYEKKIKTNEMHGKAYVRSTHVFLMRFVL
jgi:SAM-dependent methyltransferase